MVTTSKWKEYIFGVQSVNSVAEAVVDELQEVHVLLAEECKRLHVPVLSDNHRNKRLLFMFQRDLLPGISGQILESKDKRDVQSTPTAISAQWKYAGWGYLIAQNVGMLFYVMLFALFQTQQRQNAWVRSFAIWMGMEILVISTAMVLLMHIMLPAMLMKDVQSVRDKLTQSIEQYHQRLNARQAKYATNGQEGKVDGDDSEESDDESSEFNAAEYLFVSYRLAKEFSKLTISKIILQYKSPWPRRSYQYANDMKKEYDGRFDSLYRSMGLLLIFVLTNLLNVPVNMQDMIIRSLTTVVIGYLLFVQTQLYAISPALVIIPYLILFIVVSVVVVLFMRWFGCSVNTKSLSAVKLATQPPTQRKDETKHHTNNSNIVTLSGQNIQEPLKSMLVNSVQTDTAVNQHMSRRQSLQMGIKLLNTAKQELNVKLNEAIPENCSESSCESSFEARSLEMSDESSDDSSADDIHLDEPQHHVSNIVAHKLDSDRESSISSASSLSVSDFSDCDMLSV